MASELFEWSPSRVPLPTTDAHLRAIHHEEPPHRPPQERACAEQRHTFEIQSVYHLGVYFDGNPLHDYLAPAKRWVQAQLRRLLQR